MRKTPYAKYRADTVWDSCLNPDYLVLHPKIAPLKRLLSELQPALILDVGCGSKRFAQIVKQQSPNSTYIGYDIEENNEGTVDQIIEGVHNLPNKDDSVDLIICNQVLEHVDRPFEAIKELYRVLIPAKGHVFITVPLFEHEHEIPFDYFRYTQYGLEKMFEKAGFKKENVLVEPIGGAIAAFAQTFLNFLAVRQRPEEPLLIMLIKKLFFLKPVLHFYNIFFSWLDSVYFRPNPVIGYIVIANK